MLQIEKEMQEYFKNENEKKQLCQDSAKTNKTEPIKVGVPSEDKDKSAYIKPISDIKIPFAYVGLVTAGSPAEEAGLLAGDGILNFDNKIYYGIFDNPLQKVAEIVREKLNKEIHVDVLRIIIDSQGFEKFEYKTLSLIPHQWAGQGVLG